MSSVNDCIKFDLDIKDKNIVFYNNFYKFFNGAQYKVYEALLKQPACPFCGSLNFIKTGRLNVRYITADASRPIVIRLFKQRILCRDCQRRSIAQSDLVNKHCCISNASKRKVLSDLTEDRSMTSNVSVNTVQRALASCSHRFLDGYDYLPEHLTFDQFKGVDRTLHFICLDANSHTVVQILRTRYKSVLLKCFGKFSPQARMAVKTVSMDLNFYYQDIVRACFPNARIVIDRFHMAQMLARSLNLLRVQVMKQYEKSSREYKLLKSPWKLYLKKFRDLEKLHPVYNWHYKDCLTQEQIVMEGIACNEELENSYNLLQDFFEAIDNHDTAKVEELLYSQLPVGSLMHKTLLTFRRNKAAVLNEITSTYSNGCLEGFNRKIKQIERTAYGYSNFINLLTRIRLEENKIKEKEPNSYLVA